MAGTSLKCQDNLEGPTGMPEKITGCQCFFFFENTKNLVCEFAHQCGKKNRGGGGLSTEHARSVYENAYKTKGNQILFIPSHKSCIVRFIKPWRYLECSKI